MKSREGIVVEAFALAALIVGAILACRWLVFHLAGAR